MKILFVSYAFYPRVGGLEEVSRSLALEFQRRGHEVHLVTQTPSDQPEPFNFPVSRRPRAATLASLARWSDVIFHNNIALRFAWPLLIVRRPWVVAHHSFIRQSSGAMKSTDHFKKAILRFGTNIAVSNAIAKDISVPCEVVGNPYRESVFRIRPWVPRDQSLAFVGRLVSQKGVSVLIEALVLLREKGQRPSLTIFGDGNARPGLETLVANAGLSEQVTFAGVQVDDQLAESLNRFKIVVIPSIGAESFGLVALEAIACGCAVVASDIGGLKEAVGPCGWTVPPGDAKALAEQLRAALSSPKDIEERQSHARQHLSQFTVDSVSARYLKVIHAAAHSRRNGEFVHSLA